MPGMISNCLTSQKYAHFLILTGMIGMMAELLHAGVVNDLEDISDS